MAVATQLELLDLRHFSARQLRPLLEEEARMWRQRLRWDYRSSTELLLQYLDTRVLAGYVALDRGRIRGFTFYVHEGNKAVLGDAFALGEKSGEMLSTSHLLLQNLLDLLMHAPDVSRIESQLLLYERGEMDAIFRPLGFQHFGRRFLELDLRGLSWPIRVFPDGIRLTRWTAADYNHAADLIHIAYQGHIDARINDQYRTVAGSLRFLHNIVRFPGCGVFDANTSWVLRDTDSGLMVGVALCSNVGDRVAHLTQLCLAPAYRRGGLGRSLMRHTAWQLAAAGFEAITLTVTEENTDAMRLYDELGFTTRHRFDAMVFDKPRR